MPVETATAGRDRDRSRPTDERPGPTPSITPCADCTPATHGVPEGSVEAATGTPKEDVTPPSTDALTPANNTPSNDGWQLVLIALAALLATALILTPASRKVRR